jgi:tetratricopeptide (TPR) repeat protein
MDRRPDMVRALTRTLEIRPDNADALNYLGYSYAEKGERLDEAVQLIKRALLIKPDNPYIMDSLAWAFYHKGMLNEALELMKRAIAKAKDDDPVMREHFGDIYFKLGQSAKARDQWLRSLELDPKNQKLKERFTKAGFGDPEELLKDSKPRKKSKK